MIIGFDLELYDDLDKETKNWKVNTPRIACIGATEGNGGVQLWYDDGPISQEKLREFCRWLEKKAIIDDGLVVTANGLGFDFALLWYWVEDDRSKMVVRKVALEHHNDLILNIIRDLGYGVSLDNMAEALGVPGKTDEMGADAPALWRDGKYEEVLHYLTGDCLATERVFHALVEQKLLSQWRTAKSTPDKPVRSKHVWTPLMRYDARKGLVRLLTPFEVWYWKPPINLSFPAWDIDGKYKWKSES